MVKTLLAGSALVLALSGTALSDSGGNEDSGPGFPTGTQVETPLFGDLLSPGSPPSAPGLFNGPASATARLDTGMRELIVFDDNANPDIWSDPTPAPFYTRADPDLPPGADPSGVPDDLFSFDAGSPTPTPPSGPARGMTRPEIIIDPDGGIHILDIGVGATETYLGEAPPSDQTAPFGVQPGPDGVVIFINECPSRSGPAGARTIAIEPAATGVCPGVISLQDTGLTEPIFADGFESGDTSAWTEWQATR